METLNQALETYKNHYIVKMTIDDSWINDTIRKSTDYIKDGLFDHHKSFYYVEGNYCYYKDYFGRGWHKRKIDNNGFIKYQNALVMNPYTKEIKSRYDYFNR